MLLPYTYALIIPLFYIEMASKLKQIITSPDVRGMINTFENFVDFVKTITYNYNEMLILCKVKHPHFNTIL